MTASDRSIPEKKEISKEKIDKLPVVIKNHILTFFGKVGTKDFKYSSAPTFLPNPENWTPEKAAQELHNVIPKAIELFESERLPIDWKPKGYIV